jgi:perosamine synthetase
MTDIAAAIGIHQLERAEDMRRERESIAHEYLQQLGDVEELELPPVDQNRIHAWHLFPIRLRLEALALDRDEFIAELRAAGVQCSVHWRPLHLHPYYQETFGWQSADLPIASEAWKRLVSLPLFSSMGSTRVNTVVEAVRTVSSRAARLRVNVPK